jgi:hypothetical protein
VQTDCVNCADRIDSQAKVQAAACSTLAVMGETKPMKQGIIDHIAPIVTHLALALNIYNDGSNFHIA